MADIGGVLRERLAAAFGTVTGSTVDPVLRRSQHADFQSNAALAFKGRGREVAAAVVQAAALDDLCARVEVAGPGYLNLTLADAVLDRLLGELTTDDRLGVSTVEPETVVVDYSGPNAAKEMHVGHLRSTVIGDAAVRVLEFVGHRVIRQNHLGDWGTTFGLLVEHHADSDSHLSQPEDLDLNALYAAARHRFETDEAFRARSRRRVVQLQAGDEATLRLWRSLVTVSQRYFMSVYERLGVTLQDGDFAGESAYNDALDGIVADLDRLGLLRDSDGAACVFPAGFTTREGEPLPLIVRKGDGGYGYAATDLAALRHRVEELKATRLLYVVGAPQRQHLAMVFAVAAEAGWLAPPVRAVHVPFGSVLGADGKILRSRAGGALRLTELLDEAVTRAAGLVLDPAIRDEVAPAVGIGALKYADLSTDRIKDYGFDFDRMLSLHGDTAPYLQYAHARIRSIFLRGGGAGPGAFAIAEPAEHALAVELLAFASVVQDAAETLEFHRLAGYLHTLSTVFSRFYEQCPVLQAPDTVRAGRLALCELTARTLRTGLGLLGIEAPERM
jgi:arginyl-tRNA synthetase